MTEIINRISFDEFSSNLASIVDRVISEGTAVVIEKEDGELVEVKPVSRAKLSKRTKTKEDYAAFLSSLGGWEDVDVDAFLKDNYESRSISARTPIEL